ncbi:hypothetical protein EC973_000060 [Apophysomyces ossiformis]|uniref:Nitrogen regulatory protein areA GATA-like domain-containing protein n=1 Tax=Apophysomyces ossiformis TaxID=679940 RepID=A0A8H7BWJ3_9FUNG|nr:hypothetical protein EC973_000060 [Apophysomyces ossiformis]
MVQSLELPVLSLAVPNIHKLNALTSDNLSCMWTVFSKCKENLENGRRLENISWRLWFRESMMVKHQESLGAAQEREQHRQQHPPELDESFSDDFAGGSPLSVGPHTPLKHVSPSSFKRLISSLGDHPVEEAHQALRSSIYSATTKPTVITPTPTPTKTTTTTTTTAPLSLSNPRSAVVTPTTTTRTHKFFIREDDSDEEEEEEEERIGRGGFVAAADEAEGDDGWMTQDDETVLADNDYDEEDEPCIPARFGAAISERDFPKQTPPMAPAPRRSLLSTMFARQPCTHHADLASSYATLTRGGGGGAAAAAGLLARRRLRQDTVSEPLSQSLRMCVDWERYQNAPFFVASLDYPPSSVSTYQESFTGW